MTSFEPCAPEFQGRCADHAAAPGQKPVIKKMLKCFLTLSRHGFQAAIKT